MDVDGFWDLVERSAEETRDKGERVKWLKEHLSGLSAEEIVDYHTWFTIHRNRACTWDMYAVCYYVAEVPPVARTPEVRSLDGV